MSPTLPAPWTTLNPKDMTTGPWGIFISGRWSAKDPWILFPGNLQGRHIRETGSKGASLITVENGQVTDVTHHELDVLRFCKVRVDLSHVSTIDAVHDPVRQALEATTGDNQMSASWPFGWNSQAKARFMLISFPMPPALRNPFVASRQDWGICGWKRSFSKPWQRVPFRERPVKKHRFTK